MFNTFTFIGFAFFFGAIIIGLFLAANRSFNKYMLYFVVGLALRIVMTLYYHYVALHESADAMHYLDVAQNTGFQMKSLLDPGTKFLEAVTSLIYPSFTIFDDPFLMLFLPFTMTGFIGSFLLLKVMDNHFKLDRRILILFCFLLPNGVFWSTNVGKDSIISFCLSLFLYGLCSKDTTAKLISMGFSSVLVYMIRPHIFLFLFLSVAVGMVVQRRKIGPQSIAVIVVSVIVVALTYRTVFGYVGIKTSEDQTEMADYYTAGVQNINSRTQATNELGGTTTGRSGASMVLAPFYFIEYVASPFLWQVRNPRQAISALESLLYQFILLYLIVRYKDLLKTKQLQYKLFMVVYIFLTGLASALVTTNIGLANRQRWMILPYMFMLFLAIKADRTPPGKKGVWKIIFSLKDSSRPKARGRRPAPMPHPYLPRRE